MERSDVAIRALSGFAPRVMFRVSGVRLCPHRWATFPAQGGNGPNCELVSHEGFATQVGAGGWWSFVHTISSGPFHFVRSVALPPLRDRSTMKLHWPTLLNDQVERA